MPASNPPQRGPSLPQGADLLPVHKRVTGRVRNATLYGIGHTPQYFFSGLATSRLVAGVGTWPSRPLAKSQKTQAGGSPSRAARRTAPPGASPVAPHRPSHRQAAPRDARRTAPRRTATAAAPPSCTAAPAPAGPAAPADPGPRRTAQHRVAPARPSARRTAPPHRPGTAAPASRTRRERRGRDMTCGVPCGMPRELSVEVSVEVPPGASRAAAGRWGASRPGVPVSPFPVPVPWAFLLHGEGVEGAGCFPLPHRLPPSRPCRASRSPACRPSHRQRRPAPCTDCTPCTQACTQSDTSVYRRSR